MIYDRENERDRERGRERERERERESEREQERECIACARTYGTICLFTCIVNRAPNIQYFYSSVSIDDS